jgi:hypothetical protein
LDLLNFCQILNLFQLSLIILPSFSNSIYISPN